MDFTTLLFFITTLGIGVALGMGAYNFLIGRRSLKSEPSKEASILIERIEKVFKVVMAEGYFTEIYNYQHKLDVWRLFKDKKKALIIAKAKVLVGFDFSKMRIQVDGASRKIIIEYFPAPEVLSMDTEYKFYDIEQGWINRFQTEDYTNILSEAKETMNEKAMESDLPRIANNQIQLMMYQLAASMNWKVDMQLSETNQKMLNRYTTYRELEAGIASLPRKDEEEND